MINPQQRAIDVIEKLKYSINYYRINLSQLFQNYDSYTAANQYLDMNEMGMLLRKIDPYLQEFDIQCAFQYFDHDRSGFVTFNEFCTVLQQPT